MCHLVAPLREQVVAHPLHLPRSRFQTALRVAVGQCISLYSSTQAGCQRLLLSLPLGVSPIFSLHHLQVPAGAVWKWAGLGGIL
jgi:hypothetical protein